MIDKWELVVVSEVSLKDLFAGKPITSPPIKMRKKDPQSDKGEYLYRDPTPKEIEEYIESEAW